MNVGDDWGLETLAWTKMSYRPVEMLRKFTVKKMGVTTVAVPEQKPELTLHLRREPPTVRPARVDDIAGAEEIERSCFPGQRVQPDQAPAPLPAAPADGGVSGRGGSGTTRR